MASMYYRVPYVITPIATDTKSSKRVSNNYYFKNADASSGSPAYGSAIIGAASTSTFLTNFATAYGGILASILSVNYVLTEYLLRSIIGWKYKTPKAPVIAVTLGADSELTTSIPHGLSSLQTVFVSGITGITNITGLFVATVTSATTFKIPTPTSTGSYTGGGLMQLVQGKPTIVYGDKDVLIANTAGGRTGQAVPLFSDASVDRTAIAAGKNFRSRLSIAPIAESDQQDGRFDTTRLGVINAALTTFFGGYVLNGGSDTTGDAQMQHHAFSPTLAFATPQPFTTSQPFMSFVSGAFCQPNLGSNVKRKPRLTATIA